MKSKNPKKKRARQLEDEITLSAALKRINIPRILNLPAKAAIRDRYGRQTPADARNQAIKRDLNTLNEAAELVLQGAKHAEAQLLNVLAAARERFSGSRQNKGYNYGLAAMMLQLGDDFQVDDKCRDSLEGRLRALQAASTLDFHSDVRGAQWAQTANNMISESFAQLREDEFGGAQRSGSRHAGRPQDFEDRGGPVLPPEDGSRGPREGLGDPLSPSTPEPIPSFCEQLGDLIGQAYVDWAIGTDVDPNARLIGKVEPPCAKFDLLRVTQFRATPAEGKQFPNANGVRLMFGDHDITNMVDSWQPDEIAFHLPNGSHSSVLYLQGPLVARSGLSSQALGRILGLASELLASDVRIGPGVPIGVIYPPEIRLLTVNGNAVGEEPILLEACKDSARILWQVGMAETRGVGVPGCAGLEVLLVSEAGDVLDRSELPAGEVALPPSARDEDIQLVAIIRFDGDASHVRRIIKLRRQRRLHLEMKVPNHPQIIGSQHGVMRVYVSCEAPHGGIRVDLQNSAPAILSSPNFIPIQERSASVEFAIYSRPDHHGNVRLIARADNHLDAELEILVIEPHTAVVLSGGGAKGDFEAGACSYLLHNRWNELAIQTIVGTSVGSINAIGLAHNSGNNTARRIEDSWLELQRNSDMFLTSDWIRYIASNSGVDVEGPLAQLGGSAGGGAGLSVEPLGFFEIAALSIPFFGNIFAIIGASDANDTLEAVSMILGCLLGRGRTDEDGDFYIIDNTHRNRDIQRLVSASSLFKLEPTIQRLTDSIDMQQIVDGGLNLRLCMVALDDGHVYYVDERGRLLRNAAGDVLDEPITGFGYPPNYTWTMSGRRDNLVAGAMASSAFPFFFPTVRISTAGNSFTMVDGGVREVLPVRAAIDLGANLLICIAASNAEVEFKSVAVTANLVDVALRSIGIQGSEVAREDRLEAKLTCRGDLELLLIQPNFEIHGSFEIDSAKIRISLAYGYMRAFDEFLKRENLEAYRESSDSTDAIIEMRLAICEREEQVLEAMLHSPRILRGLPTARDPSIIVEICYLSPDELSDLRVMKRDLFQLVYDRFIRFGETSLPRIFGTPHKFRSERVFDWWEFWEHLDPRRTPSSSPEYSWAALSLPGKPFDKHITWDPNTGTESEEAGEPQPPVVPQDFMLAMSV